MMRRYLIIIISLILLISCDSTGRKKHGRYRVNLTDCELCSKDSFNLYNDIVFNKFYLKFESTDYISDDTFLCIPNDRHFKVETSIESNYVIEGLVFRRFQYMSSEYDTYGIKFCFRINDDKYILKFCLTIRDNSASASLYKLFVNDTLIYDLDNSYTCDGYAYSYFMIFDVIKE